MTKSSEWRTLSEDPGNTSESKTDGNCETNTHISERKRSSKTKTHSRYIQDIVSFLKHEAVKKEEHKTVGSNHVVRVTLGGDSVLARKKTLKLAKDAAAKEMMIMIGPYIEDDVWKRHSEQLSEAVPPQLRNTWLPPVFDARHVAVDGATWYEVDVQLGPLSAVSVTDNLHTSLESLASHTRHFLTTRNLEALTREPLEESLQEMEVYPHLAQPYVQARGVLEVRMDGPDGAPVIPPVDVFTMQLHLPGGSFPPSYGARAMMMSPIPGNVPGPSNPEAAGMKKKITAEKKLEKYSGGEIVMPEGEEGDSNAAYTGKIGKTGFNSKKETAKYAALPPPEHSEWNNIFGNENSKIDSSMANLRPVGANFKANKAGVRVCIPWTSERGWRRPLKMDLWTRLLTSTEASDK